MKNVFFALVFMLVGTFAFANNAEVETIDDNVTIENVLIVDEVTLGDEMTCGFPLSYDTAEHGTGSFYFGCDGSTTMDDILSVIFALFC
jgi:hypothetical protein